MTLSALDLFAGPGGLSLGLTKAGLKVVAAVEWDANACKTFATLHPDVDLWQRDAAEVDFKQYRGEVLVVVAGAPCQPFSSGGKRLAHQDPRDGLPQFVRAVREIEPVGFLLENVPGLIRGSRRPYFYSLVDALTDLGYMLAWEILNAADYGVPQKRRRLFVVGMRGKRFRFPAPTHGLGRPRPWVPAGSVLKRDEVIGDPNPSIVTYAKKPDLRPSPYDGHLFNGGGRPIDLDAPSHTILASAGGNKTHFIDVLGVVPKYHAHLLAGGEPWVGKVPGARRLTVEESALLQTFPRGIQFAGSRSSQYTQVGNAVPPLLAQRLGEALIAELA